MDVLQGMAGEGRAGEARAILPTHILHYLVGREQMGVFIMRERGQEKVKEKLITQEKQYTKRHICVQLESYC